jgi:hypothetical protein
LIAIKCSATDSHVEGCNGLNNFINKKVVKI